MYVCMYVCMYAVCTVCVQKKAVLCQIGSIKHDPHLFTHKCYAIMICNGNRTEWSTIQEVIGRLISNQTSV